MFQDMLNESERYQDAANGLLLASNLYNASAIDIFDISVGKEVSLNSIQLSIKLSKDCGDDSS